MSTPKKRDEKWPVFSAINIWLKGAHRYARPGEKSGKKACRGSKLRHHRRTMEECIWRQWVEPEIEEKNREKLLWNILSSPTFWGRLFPVLLNLGLKLWMPNFFPLSFPLRKIFLIKEYFGKANPSKTLQNGIWFRDACHKIKRYITLHGKEGKG